MHFELQKYRGPATRQTCPACKRPRSFSRYIDTETGQPVHANVGRCNREQSCGYHRTPSDHARENGLIPPVHHVRHVPPPPHKAPIFIDFEQVRQTRQDYHKNGLIRYLRTFLPDEVVMRLITAYHIGTIHRPWPEATVLWQLDTYGQVVAGKVMVFDPATGKRSKEKFTSMHRVLNIDGPQPIKVLFGEHLLRLHPKMPVGVTESAKSALVAAAYLPNRVWLSSEGRSMLTTDRCRVLAGRNVEFFPDGGCLGEWEKRVKSFDFPGSFTVSRLVEDGVRAGRWEAGTDLADILPRYDYEQYQSRASAEVTVETHAPAMVSLPPPPPPTLEQKQHMAEAFDLADLLPAPAPAVTSLPAWDVAELEIYFAAASLPNTFRLDSGALVTDVRRFVEGHLAIVAANNGARFARPYLERLQKLKDHLADCG